MRYNKKHLSVLIGFAAASALVQGALAQENDSPRKSQPRQLEEIVVSAQRNEELLQDVPLAITAYSENMLRNSTIDGNEQLPQLAPSLSFQRGANGASLFIRGVGTTSTSVAAESPVAMYVDGFYYPDFSAATMNFANVERVEVLRGPQGTLFGRNTTGGVVQVITKTPGPGAEGSVELSYGNYNEKTANVYGALGGQKLAADLSVYFEEHDAWGKNFTTGESINYDKQISIRSKWALNIDERTDAILSVDYSHMDNAYSLTTVDGDRDIFGRPGPRSIYDTRLSYDLANGKTSNDTYFESKGLGLKLSHDFDFATLVSMTGYRRSDAAVYADLDATELDLVNVGYLYDDKGKAVTQELQLLSATDSSYTWILGAFYQKSQGAWWPLFITGPLADATGTASHIYAEADTDSFSLYGQATMDFTDNLRGTFGLRRTQDKQELHGEIDTATDITLVPFDQDERWGKTTWRLALDYNFTADVLGYASYNRGFKSGLYNLQDPLSDAVDPETLDAYEIGLKSTLLDRQLTFNINAYYYDYQDLQVETIIAGSPTVANAAEATVLGVESEIVALIGDFIVSASASWMPKAEYDKFTDAVVHIPLPTGGNDEETVDVSGNRMILTPKWVGNLGVQYRKETSVGTLNLAANYNYRADSYADYGNYHPSKSYGLVNVRAALMLPGDRLEFAVSAQNLLDEEYQTNVISTEVVSQATPAAPQTYRASVRFIF